MDPATDPSVPSEQDQIDALTARVVSLETQMAAIQTFIAENFGTPSGPVPGTVGG